MRTLPFEDPLCLPGTTWDAEAVLAQAQPLGALAQAYLARRGIAVDLAEAAGVRFHPDFGGRPALVVALRDEAGRVVGLHGRYVATKPGENKMLTLGPGGGLIGVGEGWRAEPLILVEGLFDALSLAVVGGSAVATIGRWAPWLPEVTAGRGVWLGFDAGRPGEAEADRFALRLPDATLRRLPPPPRCKDWNTALRKRGAEALRTWVARGLARGGTTLS
ncbi:MAG: toprim domain-containing protein [Acidobacteria bacterium]|nr:toprim domain-containing protein [Acidobacteriota bacterium]